MGGWVLDFRQIQMDGNGHTGEAIGMTNEWELTE